MGVRQPSGSLVAIRCEVYLKDGFSRGRSRGVGLGAFVSFFLVFRVLWVENVRGAFIVPVQIANREVEVENAQLEWS